MMLFTFWRDSRKFWAERPVERGRSGSRPVGPGDFELPRVHPDGFRLVAACDGDPGVVGEEIAGLKVLPMDQLDRVVREKQISIAIVAVPVNRTQEVIDQLVECGVQAILNYAPISPQVQRGVRVRNIDPILSLQSMTFYLSGKPD